MTTLQGTLKHGLRVGDNLHKDFVLRESTTADLFDAEEQVPASRQLAFRAAVLGRQVVKLGDLDGPLDFKLIRKLHRDDYALLLQKQEEVNDEGKDEPAT